MNPLFREYVDNDEVETRKYYFNKNLFLVKMVEGKFDDIKRMTNEIHNNKLWNLMHDRFIDDLVLATTETKINYVQLQDIRKHNDCGKYRFNFYDGPDSVDTWRVVRKYHEIHKINDPDFKFYDKVTNYVRNKISETNFSYDMLKLGEEINEMYKDHLPDIPVYRPNNLPKNREAVKKIIDATPAYWYLMNLDLTDVITPVSTAQIIRAVEKMKPDQIKLMFHDIRNIFRPNLFIQKREFTLAGCTDLVKNIPDSIKPYVVQYIKVDKLAKSQDSSYGETKIQLQNYGIYQTQTGLSALGLCFKPSDMDEKYQFNFYEELNNQVIRWMKSNANENMIIDALVKNNFECVRIQNYIGSIENPLIYQWYFYKYDIFGTALTYGYYKVVDAIINHALHNKIILYRNIMNEHEYRIGQYSDGCNAELYKYGIICDRLMKKMAPENTYLKHLFNNEEFKADILQEIKADGRHMRKIEVELEEAIVNKTYAAFSHYNEIVDGILERVIRYSYDEQKYRDLIAKLMSETDVKTKKQCTKDIAKLFRISSLFDFDGEIEKIWMYRMEDIEYELSVSQMQHLGDNNQHTKFIDAYNMLVDAYDVAVDKYEADYEMLCGMFPKSQIRYDFKPRYSKMQNFHVDHFETLFHTWLSNYQKMTVELRILRDRGCVR